MSEGFVSVCNAFAPNVLLDQSKGFILSLRLLAGCWPRVAAVARPMKERRSFTVLSHPAARWRSRAALEVSRLYAREQSRLQVTALGDASKRAVGIIFPHPRRAHRRAIRRSF